MAWVREQGRGVHVRRLYDCSAEEIRVLALLSAGRTNQEIAHRLKIPPGKLSARLRAIYRRLNSSRRSEIAKYYAEWRKENHQTGDEF